MNVVEYDIEVYPNAFMVGLKDYNTKEVTHWEVSKEYNNLFEINNFFTKYDKYLVSFNGIHYDNLIIKYIIKHYKELSKLSIVEINTRIKRFSDLVIDREVHDEKLKPYIYQEQSWIDIDLFCYWSKMLRISKKISLKSLGIQLNYPVVQELPYSPSTELTSKQLKEVRNYNNVHDLGILDFLFIRMLPDVSLRKAIKKDYNLNCMSWDAIKIASESLLQDYCNETNQNPNDVRKWKFEKPTIHVKDILSDFNPNFKLKVFQDLYNRILNSVDEFSEELIVNEGNTSLLLSYGVGGLHNLFENKMYNTDENYVIVDSDVASLYPNLIINYKCIRFLEVLDRYKNIKSERMIFKKTKQKIKDLFFKLQLNG